jgi:trimeric autotransporter adhesin
VGASSASTGAFTTLTASTSLNIAASTTVDGVLDEDNMASNSATKLATQQSIKAYVDSQVGTVDTLAEILANGNTSGANNLIIDNGQAITTNTVNETTAGSGVTIDSVLLKDDGVNATNLEITNIKANDGTAAGSIANSTGAVTITSFISNSVDIGGGAIDDTAIGNTTPAAGTFTSLTSTGGLTVTNGASVQGLTVGRGAGAVATNTAVGASALAANTSGATNTALGERSLFSTTTGVGNTAVGIEPSTQMEVEQKIQRKGMRQALTYNTGSTNSAYGYQALFNSDHSSR